MGRVHERTVKYGTVRRRGRREGLGASDKAGWAGISIRTVSCVILFSIARESVSRPMQGRLATRDGNWGNKTQLVGAVKPRLKSTRTIGLQAQVRWCCSLSWNLNRRLFSVSRVLHSSVWASVSPESHCSTAP